MKIVKRNSQIKFISKVLETLNEKKKKPKRIKAKLETESEENFTLWLKQEVYLNVFFWVPMTRSVDWYVDSEFILFFPFFFFLWEVCWLSMFYAFNTIFCSRFLCCSNETKRSKEKRKKPFRESKIVVHCFISRNMIGARNGKVVYERMCVQVASKYHRADM